MGREEPLLCKEDPTGTMDLPREAVLHITKLPPLDKDTKVTVVIIQQFYLGEPSRGSLGGHNLTKI